MPSATIHQISVVPRREAITQGRPSATVTAGHPAETEAEAEAKAKPERFDHPSPLTTLGDDGFAAFPAWPSGARDAHAGLAQPRDTSTPPARADLSDEADSATGQFLGGLILMALLLGCWIGTALAGGLR